MQADKPEDCLATFVELFVFKFLNDLSLLTLDATGQDVSVQHVMSTPREIAYAYYDRVVRPHIKKMFPTGPDGYSIINGIVLQPSNRDHNIIFHEIMKKFIKFGTLKNTDPEFKTHLYESFLQESKTTSTFGQHFTPRKIVSAIHDMAEIDNLTNGRTIYDPASGVGGFILEQMARNLGTQWTLRGNQMKPVHTWLAHEIVPKTTILAKANALVHCGDYLANQPARIPSFAKWLNKVFICQDKTTLGSLERMYHNKFDLILTNPPFVVSGSRDIGKIIHSNNKRARYYSQKASGVEGLFIQFIVHTLKPNAHAWVLLPETFFLRSPDTTLRNWLLANCRLDFIAILPERTFFNTPKKSCILHLKKRSKLLSNSALQAALKKQATLLFAVSEIGETRDAKRLPCDSDLPEMVAAYKRHSAGLPPDPNSKRTVSIDSHQLYDQTSLNLRLFWDNNDAIALGLLGAEKNPVVAVQELRARITALQQLTDEVLKTTIFKTTPPQPQSWRTVKLGDTALFTLRIGKRVLKKTIYQNRTGVPLFSANVRKPFGYVHSANAGNLPNGGVLWSIDSDFDCRGIAPGEPYSITDHCGQLTLLSELIDPNYLASQIRKAGTHQGFTREYRPSLSVMAELTIDLPVKPDGTLDLPLMQQWSAFADKIAHTNDDIKKVLDDI